MEILKCKNCGHPIKKNRNHSIYTQIKHFKEREYSSNYACRIECYVDGCKCDKPEL